MTGEDLYARGYSPLAARREESAYLLYGEELPGADVARGEMNRRAMVAEWRARVTPPREQDVVVMLSGGPGSGKSDLALVLAMDYEPGWADRLEERCITTPEMLLAMYEPIPGSGRGKYAFIDEAFAMHLKATETFDPLQGIIVDALNILRSLQWCVVILTQEPDMLCLSLRSRRANYHVQTDPIRYGVPATASWGRKVEGKKYFATNGRWLGYMEPTAGNPLTYPFLGETDPELWARYQAAKVRAQGATLADLNGRLSEIRRKERERRERP